MTNKQKLAIALMCAIAALLAGLMLWRRPAAPAAPHGEAHAGHQDSHGHDDRHPQEAADGAPSAADERGVAMSAAQIKANGIVLDTAKPATVRERLHLPAQIAVDAERTVALAAPARGIVRAVFVSPGAAVVRGQPLVAIQSPAVAQWRAELASSAQRLQLARTTYRREKTLWDEGISARQDLDAAQTALKEAEIAAQAAHLRLDALGIAAEGGLSSAATVRAPLAGIVLERPAVPGQSVDESTPLASIADLSRVWIEAAVPADSLGQVAVGMPAKVSVNTLPHQLDGTVAFVGPVLGATTRMATARIALPNPALRLRPGMLATVDLLGPQAEVPVTVASEAVQTIHEHDVVFVRTAAGFRAQDVTLGRSDGRRTEIVKGLAAGTSYATAGSFLLKADLGKAEAEHDD